jgi:hypothetical protein
VENKHSRQKSTKLNESLPCLLRRLLFKNQEIAMKIQNERILTGLAALVAAGMTTQAQENPTTLDDSRPCDLPGRAAYAYTTLDEPLAAYPGGTAAVGISGHAIVGYYGDSLGNYHGFLYNDQDKTWTTLDDPDGVYGTTFCYNISGNDIIGIYGDTEGDSHGFLYNGETWITLDDPLAGIGPGLGTFPSGLQGRRIVGPYADNNSVYHGFLYDANDQTWTTFDEPLAGSAPDTILGQGTSPEDIQGDLIVGAYTDSEFVYHGFLYNIKDKTWITFDDPLAGIGPGQGTGPNGISGDEITGLYFDSVGVSHGFVYNGRAWTTLDDPLAGSAPGQGTFAQYSSANRIVGWYVDSNGYRHGFLATPTCGRDNH